ncbi:MAG: sulfite exporter TauE/SafE family protein [Clostridia bacterium]
MSISIICISILTSTIAGMGIGGGSIFILLTTIFNLFNQKQAQGYNLIMFIAAGVSTTIINFKNNKNDKKIFKQLLIPICLGSICGIIVMKNLDENFLKYIFYGFMLIIGMYEIFSSLKSIIKGNNNDNERS